MYVTANVLAATAACFMIPAVILSILKSAEKAL